MQEIKNKIDIIEDDLKSVDGISEVSITGLPEKEIEVSVSEKKLLSYNLSLEEINSAVLQNNINLTGGKIEVNQNQYLLRSNNKQNSSAEISDIIVRVNENGSPLYLRDVAEIKDTWSDLSIERYRNNKRSINFT